MALLMVALHQLPVVLAVVVLRVLEMSHIELEPLETSQQHPQAKEIQVETVIHIPARLVEVGVLELLGLMEQHQVVLVAQEAQALHQR
jgi:hypothetical protein